MVGKLLAANFLGIVLLIGCMSGWAWHTDDYYDVGNAIFCAVGISVLAWSVCLAIYVLLN